MKNAKQFNENHSVDQKSSGFTVFERIKIGTALIVSLPAVLPVGQYYYIALQNLDKCVAVAVSGTLVYIVCEITDRIIK